MSRLPKWNKDNGNIQITITAKQVLDYNSVIFMLCYLIKNNEVPVGKAEAISEFTKLLKKYGTTFIIDYKTYDKNIIKKSIKLFDALFTEYKILNVG